MTLLANLFEATFLGSIVGFFTWSWFDAVMTRVERKRDDADVR